MGEPQPLARAAIALPREGRDQQADEQYARAKPESRDRWRMRGVDVELGIELASGDVGFDGGIPARPGLCCASAAVRLGIEGTSPHAVRSAEELGVYLHKIGDRVCLRGDPRELCQQSRPEAARFEIHDVLPLAGAETEDRLTLEISQQLCAGRC